MRKLLPVFFIVTLLLPRPAHAWGFEGHKFVMDRAIALLPAELRPLFEKHRAEVVERAIDPDVWITAGFDEERPRHFVDLDADGTGDYPFNGLPRDYSAAVGKFGTARMRDIGTLPWRTEEIYGDLRRAFAAYGRRGPFGQSDIIKFAAWLAHYTADGHVPLHAVSNYDGGQTKQWGIHSRWESTMFERYRDRLTITPTPIPPIKDPRGFIFDTLLRSNRLAPSVLDADRQAIGDRDVYDDAYYEAFFAANRSVMEQRLSQSIAAVAAMITGAWEAAGKPPVPLAPEPPVQRRRRQ